MSFCDDFRQEILDRSLLNNDRQDTKLLLDYIDERIKTEFDIMKDTYMLASIEEVNEKIEELKVTIL